MKSPVLPFRPELLRTMHAARAQHAATLFDPVTIKTLLTTAASEGLAHCLLPVPLDLRTTAAAKTIVAWCAKEGLQVDWVSRPAAEAHGDQPYDLVISWRPLPSSG